MKRLLLLISVFIISGSSFSQFHYWQNIYGTTSFYDLKAAANGYLYTCQNYYDGIIRSTDHGQTWTGNNSPNIYINRIAIDRNDVIYAGNKLSHPGIKKSTDYGQTWTVSYSPILFTTALHASKDGYIYAGSSNGEILISSDAGNTWRKDSLSRSVSSITTTSDGQVFACVECTKIVTSTNHGQTWTVIPYTGSVCVISIAADSNNYLYAGTDYHVYKSTNYGMIWTNTSGSFSVTDRPLILVDSRNRIFYSNNGVHMSTDQGQSWTFMNGPAFTGLVDYQDKLLASANGIYLYDPSAPIYVGTNYMPMHVGTCYQYFYETSFQGAHYYFMYNKKITQNTIINGKEYFKFAAMWMRYSEQDKKLYSIVADSERVHMDFNKAPGDHFMKYISGVYPPWWQAVVYSGSTTLFNTVMKYKGYTITGGFSSPKQDEAYAENFGPIQTYGVSQETGFVKQALIYDSLGNYTYYSQHYKPQIALSPITIISNRNFLLNFSVNHTYNSYASGPGQSLNYIDSVNLESFYSKGDSIKYNPVQSAEFIQLASYRVTKYLDTLLLKDGYTFNYRTVAKDKSIIPEVSYSPVGGNYYKCVWNFGTAVKDKESSINGYELFQNYPNPFNPITSIGYYIQHESKVTIKIMNTLGERVREYDEGVKASGFHELKFEGSNLSSGVYFYSINASSLDGENSYSAVKKMVLQK